MDCSPTLHGSGPNPDPVVPEVRRRSGLACDACKARKIKCVYEGNVCRACRTLNIPCTQNRPRKRRGPVNRYIQNLHANNPVIHHDPPPSSTRARPDLGSLASPAVIEQVIHEWFDTIHWVCPIFHRSSFLTRLSVGDATLDLQFCALVASVCAVTVANLARRSRVHYGSITVAKCLEVVDAVTVSEARPRYTLEWCQTRYNMAIAIGAERDMDDMEMFRFLAEAVCGVKRLIYHELPDMTFRDQQLLKRLYWLLFAASCTMDLHGRPFVGLLSPQDDITDLMPLELSDDDLEREVVGPQEHPDDHANNRWQGDSRSYVAGLNHLSQLYLLWHKTQTGVGTQTVSTLRSHLNAVRRALDYLPPELQWRGGLSRHPDSNFGTEVQTANLYLTQLHIRYNILERMKRLASSTTSSTTTPPQPAESQSSMVKEQQSLVDDMLQILYHVPEEVLEANGHSLLPKVRDIGSAMLVDDEDAMALPSPSVFPDSSNDLHYERSNRLFRLLAKLDSLDKPKLFPGSGPSPTFSPQEGVDSSVL